MSANGQSLPPDYWHPGTVVFINGDSVKGKVKYNFDQNIVQLSYQDRIYSYTPQKVDHFYFYDITNDSLKRNIKTFDYNKTENYIIPIFFEILVDKKRPLLRRESVVVRTNAGVMMQGFTNTYRVLDYEYYYRTNDKISDVPGRRRKLAKSFGSEWRAILDYMKDNNLRATNQRHLIKLYNYFNNTYLNHQVKNDEEETNNTGDQ